MGLDRNYYMNAPSSVTGEFDILRSLGRGPDVQSPMQEMPAFSFLKSNWGLMGSAPLSAIGQYFEDTKYKPKKDYNFSPQELMFEGKSIENLRAENLGFWSEQLWMGLGQAVVLTGTTAVRGTLGLINGTILGISNLTEGGSFWEGMHNNPVMNAMNEIDKWGEKFMPIYLTQAEQDPEASFGVKFFSGGNFANNIIKNIGFTAGSALTGTAWIQGVRAAGLTALAGRGMVAAQNVKLIKPAANKAIHDAVNTAINQGKSKILGEVVFNQAVAGIASGLGEAVFNAKDTYEQYVEQYSAEQKEKFNQERNERIGEIFDHLITNDPRFQLLMNYLYVPLMGMEANPADKLRIDAMNDEINFNNQLKLQEAYNEAVGVFYLNYEPDIALREAQALAEADSLATKIANYDAMTQAVVNIPANMLMFGRMWKGNYNTGKNQIKNFITRNPETGLFSVNKAAITGKAMAGFAGNFTFLGLEEVWLTASQRMSRDFVEGHFMEDDFIENKYSYGAGRDASTTFFHMFDAMTEAVEKNGNLTDTMVEFFSGAAMTLLPIPGGVTRNSKGKIVPLIGFHPYDAYKEVMLQNRLVSDAITHINKIVESPDYNLKWETIVRHNAYESKLLLTLLSDNKMEFLDTSAKQFLNMVYYLDLAGILDSYVKLIQDMKDIGGEEALKKIKESLTTEDGKSLLSHLEGLKVEELIAYLHQRADHLLDEVNAFVEIRNHIEAMYGKVLNDNAKEQLTMLMYMQLQWENRVSDLTGQAQEALKDATKGFDDILGKFIMVKDEKGNIFPAKDRKGNLITVEQVLNADKTDKTLTRFIGSAESIISHAIANAIKSTQIERRTDALVADNEIKAATDPLALKIKDINDMRKNLLKAQERIKYIIENPVESNKKADNLIDKAKKKLGSITENITKNKLIKDVLNAENYNLFVSIYNPLNQNPGKTDAERKKMELIDEQVKSLRDKKDRNPLELRLLDNYTRYINKQKKAQSILNKIKEALDGNEPIMDEKGQPYGDDVLNMAGDMISAGVQNGEIFLNDSLLDGTFQSEDYFNEVPESENSVATRLYDAIINDESLSKEEALRRADELEREFNQLYGEKVNKLLQQLNHANVKANEKIPGQVSKKGKVELKTDSDKDIKKGKEQTADSSTKVEELPSTLEPERTPQTSKEISQSQESELSYQAEHFTELSKSEDLVDDEFYIFINNSTPDYQLNKGKTALESNLHKVNAQWINYEAAKDMKPGDRVRFAIVPAHTEEKQKKGVSKTGDHTIFMINDNNEIIGTVRTDVGEHVKGLKEFRDLILSQFDNINELSELNDRSDEVLDIWHRSGDNAELSNFDERVFTYVFPNGKSQTFHSVEQAFQYTKGLDRDGNILPGNDGVLLDILLETDGEKIKLLGKDLNMRKTWNTDRVGHMEQFVRASFELNPDAKLKLMDTQNATLTHKKDKSIWKQAFPRILMKVRGEFLGEKVPSNIVKIKNASDGTEANMHISPNSSIVSHTRPGYLRFTPKVNGEAQIRPSNQVTDLAPVALAINIGGELYTGKDQVIHVIPSKYFDLTNKLSNDGRVYMIMRRSDGHNIAVAMYTPLLDNVIDMRSDFYNEHLEDAFNKYLDNISKLLKDYSLSDRYQTDTAEQKNAEVNRILHKNEFAKMFYILNVFADWHSGQGMDNVFTFKTKSLNGEVLLYKMHLDLSADIIGVDDTSQEGAEDLGVRELLRRIFVQWANPSFQVDVNSINKGTYNQDLLARGILGTNLESGQEVGQNFEVHLLDENGKMRLPKVQALAPNPNSKIDNSTEYKITPSENDEVKKYIELEIEYSGEDSMLDFQFGDSSFAMNVEESSEQTYAEEQLVSPIEFMQEINRVVSELGLKFDKLIRSKLKGDMMNTSLYVNDIIAAMGEKMLMTEEQRDRLSNDIRRVINDGAVANEDGKHKKASVRTLEEILTRLICG